MLATDEHITIQNAGPIEGSFEIPLSGPGLYELTGSRGRGKTTVLSALGLIAGHKTAITVHDGELAGEVSGFGVIAPIASRKRSRGELEVDTIDTERFDLTDLIDPPAKTAETRDAIRIKAIAALSGLKLSPEDFHELVGGETEFQELGIEETADPVAFCRRIKSAIEAEARRREAIADQEKGSAKAIESATGDIDLDAESDASVLAAAAEEAASKLSRLREGAARAESQRRETDQAKQRLKDAIASYKGPSSKDAYAKVESKNAAKAAAFDELEKLQAQLVEAEKAAELATHEADQALAVAESADQHESVIEQLGDVIKSDMEAAPEPEEIDAAESALEQARAAQEQGVRVRDAKASIKQADAHRELEADARAKAESLRGIAASVFSVLTAKLETKHLRVESINAVPRLVVDHETRGKTLFDQDNGLSDGERVLFSIQELLPRLGDPGMLPIPQRVYQDLPPEDRKQLGSYAAHHGLYLFGAQVTDGDLEVRKV